MSRHIEKNHSNIRRFKCEVCQKGFHNSTTLKEHMNTHTGEKPFECHDCGKKFGSNALLSQHKKIHTGEK
ncbi:MAG: C2H2-type zinc finger protein, partial [Parvibaculales bacterium]